MTRRFAARICRAIGLLSFACLLSLGASAASLVVLLDTDNSTATGCTVAIPGGGTFTGAEFVLTTFVDTTTNPPTVGPVTEQTCTAPPAGLSAPVPVAPGGWNVGLGLGVSGYDVIETFIPIGTPPAVYRLGFYYTDPISGTDTLVTTTGLAGGGPIIFALPGSSIAVPALTDGAIFLLALLIFVVAARALRRHNVPTTLVVGLFAVLMAGATLAAIVLDGQITDWAGVHALAKDPLGDASIGSDIAAAFAKAEAGRIYFRADVKTAALPGAVNDTYSTNAGVTLNVAASGVLTNDVRGIPLANVQTFGGGSAGGTAATNAAGAVAVFGVGGSLQVNANGSLAFTPATGFTGPFTFSYVIGNPSGTSTGQVTINVNQAPAITSANNATFVVGVANSFTVTTTGFPNSTITLTGCTLPANLTFTNNGNGTATLAGTAAAATGGTYSCTVTANNGIGAPATQPFTLTVNQAPAITSANAATFTAGVLGTFTVTTTGLPTNAAMVISQTGALPGGVTFVNNNNGTATLGGIPATGGSFPIVITANNGVAPNATQNFTLTVNQAPVITSANNATFAVGAFSTFTVTTTGFPAPTIARGGVALPSGISFTDNLNGTGTLSGTAASGTGGSYAITFTATNVLGSTAPQAFTLTIQQVPVAVADAYNVTHDSTLIVPVGSGLLVNDTGSPAPTANFAQGSGPACAVPCAFATTNGNVVLQADGSFNYTPNALFAGTDTFVYTVGNVQGTSAPATVTITVNNAAPVVDLNGPAGGIGFGPVAFTEGNAPVAIVDLAQLTVADGDSANLASATVTITNLLDAPDEAIGVACPVIAPGCSGAILAADVVYVAATGTLTITRSAPLADYQALLRTLTYHNAADDPDTTTRVITVVVNDGIVASAPIASVSVTLTATNDAPTITAPATAGTAVNTALPFAGTITVADVDAGTSPVKVTLTVTNGTATLSGTAGLTVTGNGTASVVATGSLTSLNAALNGMQYTPTAAYNGPATLKIDIDDQGNTGTPATPLTATHTINITVDTLPTVTNVVPANGATSVALNATVAVTFSEAVTATATAFTLECPSGSPKAFTVVPALPATNTLFTLTPTTPLAAGVTCTLTVVAAQVTDASAQNMAANFVSTFTADTLPTVTATVPTSGASGIGPVAPITITFSEPVNATAASFTLQCPVATPQTFTFAAAPPQSFTLTPNPALPTNTLCTLTVLAAQVTDVDAGQNMAANFSTTFTTAIPPAFTSAASTLFTLNVFGTFTVTTTGNPSAVVSEAGALPAGVSFAPGAGGTATLSGTPTVAGSFPLVFTATNVAGAPTQNFTLLVCPVITVNPATIAQPTTGNVYAQTLTGSGGTGPYGFTSTPRPTGMTLSGAGVLGGTVTASGAYSFTVTATDANGCTGTATYSGTINQPPVANADSYQTVGNTLLEVASPGAQATPKILFTTNNVLTNDTDADGGTLAVASVGTFATVSGGSITLAANGEFTYLPAAGFIGADSFVYTLTDGTGTATGTINLTVLAPKIWYVKNIAPAGGDGRSTTPFNTLAAAIGASAVNDTIYISSGDGTSTNQDAGALLKNGQRLIGQGAALIVATTVNGVATPTLAPAGPAPTIRNTAGNGVTLASGNTVSGMIIGTSSATMLFGSNVGALTLSTLVVNGASQGMDLTGVGAPTVNIAMMSTISTAGARNVNLVGLNGTIDLGSGTLAGATGNALDVSGGTANITYSGNITAGAAGSRAVSIVNKTGGTVGLSGNITSVVANSAGVFLNNNGGATINLTGPLGLTTGTNPAFTATGGGTVTATNANNTIVTTTGTALNVANTTIGAAGLHFNGISAGTGASGPANAIILNTTGGSGSLTVTGTGNASLGGDNSGGTIQRTTGHAISLASTLSPSFTNMNIHDIARNGIDGTGVTNFTFLNGKIANTGTGVLGQFDEALIGFNDSVAFTENNVSGTVTITGNQFSQPHRNGIDIENWAGTISNLVISNNTFAGGTTTLDILHAILVMAQGSAGSTAHITTGKIQNNTISGFEFNSAGTFIGGSGIFVAGGNTAAATSSTLGAGGNAIEISGNDVDNMGSNGIIVSFSGQNGASNFDIHDNGTAADPMSNLEGIGISVFFGGNGVFSANVVNNAIDNNGPTVNAGSSGIAVQLDQGTATTDAGVAAITVNNNRVTNPDGFGIRGIVRNSNGILNLKVQNNVVGVPSAANRNAIRIDSGSGAGDTSLCLNLSGNTGVGGGNLTGSGVNAGIGVRKQGAVLNTNEFFINAIAAGPTNPQVQAYLSGLNPTTGVDIISGSAYGTCSLP